MDEVKDPRKFKMPFGSHKGRALECIHADDPQYMDWMLDNITQWEVLENVQAFFKLENERIINNG